MDDTQTTSPATDDIATAQTPRSEHAPNGRPEAPAGTPGFSERGRMRRRMRFLRKARELAYRDLGGLVFDLHRFGRRNDALVLAKLDTIGRIDTELRALEAALAERQAVTVLREAGVAACPRCAAIHGSDDRFCPNCGLAMDLHAERPMAGPQTAAQPAPAPAPMPSPPPVTPSPPPVTPSPPPVTGSTAPPVPATATPAPATPTPSTAATPARSDAPPAGPAPGRTPSAGDGPGVDKDGPSVDQPTEIIRPPVKDP